MFSTVSDLLLGNALFKYAMSGDWNHVVEIYENREAARWAKITRAGDTVLHLAVQCKDYVAVNRLVGVIAKCGETSEILELKNEKGNTPLHLAAALGVLDSKCKSLIDHYPELIVQAYNDDGETPLFVAALRGKKDEFQQLHKIIMRRNIQGDYKDFCTRKLDGDTILHRTIVGEYFELALYIIHYYKGLVNISNRKGQTPLHLLADIPSAFKSGTRLHPLDKFIYAGLPVIIHHGEDRKVSKISITETKEKGTSVSPRCNLAVYWPIIQRKFVMLRKKYAKQRKHQPNTPQHTSLIAQTSRQPIEEYMIEMKRDEENILPEHVINPFGEADDIQRGKKLEEKTRLQIFVKRVKSYTLGVLWVSVFFLTAVVGAWRIKDMLKLKTMHTYAIRVMRELIQRSNIWEKLEAKQEPSASTKQETSFTETPILVAAKRGVTEMVTEILRKFPIAVQDFDDKKKNIVLLAAENRQAGLYKYLCKDKFLMDPLFDVADLDGNTALHLAATMPADDKHPPWTVPGAALQMQWEIKWFRYVEKSMKDKLMVRNEKGKTAKDLFTKSHEELMKEGRQWLFDTSQSCSVVAVLIATVAFASATTVPGGLLQDGKEKGYPVLDGSPGFEIFAIASLVAMCFSVTALVLFLTMLTSRYLEQDFKRTLTRRLILGLTFLFLSIAAMLIAFCAGHFYVLQKKLRYIAYPLYGVTCLPFAIFAVAHLPLYVDLIKSTFTRVPIRA